MAGDPEPRVIPRDSRGNPTFFCVHCRQPLAMTDFHTMGLREPDPGERADDYMADELVDDLAHAECAAARREAV